MRCAIRHGVVIDRWRRLLHAAWLAGFAALALAACATNSAQTSPDSSNAKPADPDAIMRQLNRLGQRAHALHNPVAAYLLYLENYRQSGQPLRGLIGQVIAATESELGAYRRAVMDYPQGLPQRTRTPAPLPTNEDARAVNAADAIAALARTRRIVMVNEVHHDAQTRLLTLELLPRLRKLGFAYFAAEALNEKDRQLNARGYPITGSGSYVREPVYGEIIRTAIQLGYHVVAYDTTRVNATPAQREQDQADHLRKRVFDKDPDARLFVHAGYAHVDERADYFYTATMAMRLARDTGLNPLSVDQTILREMAPELEYPGYRTLLQRFAPQVPSVLMLHGSDHPWSLEPMIYDVSVLLPPTHLIHGRPGWLRLGGVRVPVAVDPGPSPWPLPYVIQARHDGESPDAVPADRELITDRTTRPVLFLRLGTYRVDVLTATDRPRFLRTLHVEATGNSGL
ncbi:MAG TPA: hypothetical protein VFN13_09260 [Rudaea sp.]|nr:hypothetical protein [Rudaea sp.]